MMTIPKTFNWSEKNQDELNQLSTKEKELLISKDDINIRQSIGEAVPTVIFSKIAKNLKEKLLTKLLTNKEVEELIKTHNLSNIENLKEFISKNIIKYNFLNLSKIFELANAKRRDNSAFYTRQDIAFSLINKLPDIKNNSINILEPSVGVGNFLPLTIKKFESKNITLDLVDIDKDSLDILKIIIRKLDIPKNFTINFINEDFLLYKTNKKYDFVIGNPPFGKVIKNPKLLKLYKEDKINQKTNNIYSFFLEKSLQISKIVAFILPKSLLSAPEFNQTRDFLSLKKISNIIDYGEKGFKGVKIETISIIIKNQEKPSEITIESYIDKTIKKQKQDYIISNSFPSWLIYKTDFFDSVAKKLEFGVFKSFRDRSITKKIPKPKVHTEFKNLEILIIIKF